jgi:membrane protein YdbS with pleckstrin-like domain
MSRLDPARHIMDDVSAFWWLVFYVSFVIPLFMCASSRRWIRWIGYAMAAPSAILVLLVIGALVRRMAQ